MSENILDKAKAAAVSAKDKITDLKENIWDSEKDEIIKEFKERGEGKVKEILEIINKYKSLFSDAGYEVNGVNASLSIPPDISISFKFLGAVDESKRQDILFQASESKIASILLKSLFKASNFAESIKIGDMKLKSISITLGLIPGISVTIA